MAAAAATCKPMILHPLYLQTHRYNCGALKTRQRVTSGSYHRHERSFNISCKALHDKRENPRRECIRAVPRGGGDKEKCNKERKDENANIDAPPCVEKTETKGLTSPDQPEPVKVEEQEKQQSSAEKEKPAPTRGRSQCFASKLGLKTTTTSRDEELKRQDLQIDSTQDVRCRLRSWWRHVTRPQNLLAAFLTGLLLYAFALFGWQVMVVAVDVTLFVLKCSFIAVVLLFMYIFLI